MWSFRQHLFDLRRLCHHAVKQHSYGPWFIFNVLKPMEKIRLWHVSSFINGLNQNLADILLQAISVVALNMKWPHLQKAQLWPLLYFQSTKAYGENMFALGFIIYQWIKTKYSRYLSLNNEFLSYEYEVAPPLNKGHNSGSLQYF